jgi:uncharacterized protein (DUF305 family)
MAQEMTDTSAAEIEELRGYREAFYGEAEPMPMDGGVMHAMAQTMPGMCRSTKEMSFQMDPEAAAIRDADLSFIDLTVVHHQTAIKA